MSRVRTDVFGKSEWTSGGNVLHSELRIETETGVKQTPVLRLTLVTDGEEAASWVFYLNWLQLDSVDGLVGELEKAASDIADYVERIREE